MEMIQRSFTSGEIAPALRSRADMVKYSTGLASCINMIVRAQGGVYSRPGTRFINELDDSSKRGRLIPFSFNTEQTYMLVFEHLKMRVIKNGGFVLDGINIFELTTPYTEEQLPRLIFTQNADVMTITNPGHDPANLNRLADDNWTLVDIDYSSSITPPVLLDSDVYVITAVTQANPAVVSITGAGSTLYTGMTIVIADIVGMTELNDRPFKVTRLTSGTFALDDEDSTAYAAYVSDGTATLSRSANTIGTGAGDYDKIYEYVVTAVVDGVESLPSSPVAILTKSLSVTAGIRLEWEPVTDAEYYRIYKDPSVNTGIFGWIGDSNTESFDDYNIAPITSDSPPVNRTPFAGTDNKPSSVTYYQQRQVFANTNNEPQTVYATQVGNYNSMRVSNPLRDDDALTFTIAANQVNEIRHMLDIGGLVLFTSGGEFLVNETQDQLMSVGGKFQSRNGSSWVPPAIVNSTALYVQEKGTRVRDLNYEFASDKYTGNDLSLMSEHLFEGHTIVEMSYSAEPFSILWCIRDDGVLLGLTYQREHQVFGWHRHVTDGEFESVATITEDGRDAVYLIVKRTIDGNVVRYVERMETRFFTNAEDSFCVDSGLTYDGAPADVITGLDHLEGEAVAVLADGYVVEDLTVSGGSITLPRDASLVHVGLPYLPVIETLDLDIAATTETLKSYEKSVNRVVLEVEKSRGGWVGGLLDDGTYSEMQEIKPRFQSDSYGVIPLRTFKHEVNISPGWSKGGGIRIEQRAPLPLTILSVIPRFDVGG